MTKNELTLDQLSAIAGGVQMASDGSTCTDRHIRKAMETSKRMQKFLKNPCNGPARLEIGGSPDPGGDDV